MSNSEQPEQPELGKLAFVKEIEQPVPTPPEDDIDYEAMAEVVKTGVDRLISATKRSNGKQISFQVGEVSRNLIALSKACMAGVKKPRIIT